MSCINPKILNEINIYKNTLFEYSNELQRYMFSSLQVSSNSEPVSLLSKLFYIIYENIQIDLNNLAVLNPDYDVMGFPALHRNMRTTIEAFYDLYNLSNDILYVEVLKTNSVSTSETLNLAPKFIKYKKEKSFYYSLKEKANIALNLYGIDKELFDSLKSAGAAANTYVHPDVYAAVPSNRAGVLANLIFLDCRIILLSSSLIYQYLHTTYDFTLGCSPEQAFHTLTSRTSTMGSIIVS